jgi:hypothetical protein
MVRFLSATSVIALMVIGSAFAAEPNCRDQLAQVKPQVTSELLAQSMEADRYKEAERLCAAGKDAEAQQLAKQISQEIAQKRASGSSRAPAAAGTAGAGTSAQGK